MRLRLSICLIAISLALAADSPWSKTVQARMTGNPPAVVFQNPGGRKNHRPLADSTAQGASNSPFAFYGMVNVVWASAAPVRATLPEDLLASPNDYYVIGVSGLPSQALREIPQHLLATLVAKRLRPANVDSIWLTNNRRTVMFAFPRAKFPIGQNPITFRLKIRDMTVEAKFEPKEMRYQGEPAF